MRIQRSWVLSVLTIIALVIAVHEARAQSYPYPGAAPSMVGYPGVGPQMPTGIPGPAANTPSFAPQYAPESFAYNGLAPTGNLPMGMPPQYASPGPMPPPQAGMMPAGGPYGYQPAAYYDPAQGAPPQQLSPSPATPMDGAAPYGYPPEGYPTEGASCGYCGGYGCEVCGGVCDDFDLRLLQWLLPYGAGGCGAQRWYDASLEWVTMSRDGMGESTVFATEGPNGVPVLSLNQLDFSDSSGFRASFAIQLGAGNLLETTYLGSFNWKSKAEVTSESNDLFSIISDFGVSPPFGFTDTDRAAAQRIEYSSTFDTIELNYRQRWVGPNTRIQGSWLVGARYMYMTEDFRYLTFAPINPGDMNYLVSTSNSMTGGQLGGDLWICIMPGLSIGGEIKGGIYGNRAVQRTTINAYSLFDPILEKEAEDGVAFLGEANLMLIWRMSQHWTFRTGFVFLGMTDIALATDNFNAAPPLVAGVRSPFINNSSDVSYSGFTLGLEYMW